MKLAHAAAIAALLLQACTNSSPADTNAAASEVSGQSQNQVSGRVLFAPGSTIPTAWQTAPVSGVVKLVDVTYQDAPSTDVTSAAFTAKNGDAIPFQLSLAGAKIDPTRSYAIYAHLDADGNGQVSNGDFVTVQSYPVLTGGNGSVVDVEIVEVGKPAAANTVSGNVLLAGDTSSVAFPLSGVVRVVDVTYQDGPSTTIATQTISVTGPGPIPFSIPVSNIDAKASYTVQVHLDTDADGAVSEGDFISVESFPVLTFGHGSVIDVTAQRL